MSTKPNILIITTDQQHYNAVSALGNPNLKTPGINRIYNDGTIYTNAYTTNPVCGPSRSSLLTGRMPCETGVYNNGMKLRHGIPHIGQWFTKRGYTSVFAGKWHLRENWASDINGFDTIMTGINIQANSSDTGVTSSVEAYLRNYNDDKPFLMMAMYVQPHDICGFVNYFTNEQDMLYEIPEDELPELPPNFNYDFPEPDKFLKFKNRIPSSRGNWDEKKWRYYLWHYYRYVEGVDCEISRLLDVLDDTGLSENTIVVFLSDHGENTANHRTTLKTTFYNESCKIPMAIYNPFCKSEHTFSKPVSIMDVFPTICDYANIGLPEKLTGKSLYGSQPDRKGVLIENYGGRGRAYVTEKYKYIAFNDDDQPQLFNLTADPYEQKNIINDAEYKNIMIELSSCMEKEFNSLDIAECIPEDARW